MSARVLKTKKSGTMTRVGETRKQLKRVALNVFSEKSFDAATVEKITEKAYVLSLDGEYRV